MKKATILAFACALFMGQAAVAQESAKEITYVNDPSQGYLFNRFQDNWFITAEGGTGIYLSSFDSKRNLLDRFSPAASIYAGKWFSPIIGLRAGINYLGIKGLTENPAYGLVNEHMTDGLYKEKFNLFGPQVDVMLNLTNWWCGYRPGRIYNATFYLGAGGYFTFAKRAEGNKDAKWKHVEDDFLDVRAGLINSFRVSEQVQLSLDIRLNGFKGPSNFQNGSTKLCGDLQAYFGVTYNFKNREWSTPVVPVCPEPENCDALRARLAAADARIADLEAQLRDCLNRPVEKVTEKGPLATIYYPIGVSRLTREDRNILGAIANVMIANPNTHYTLTGWADNYTGTEQINIRLRKNRVAGVEKQLIKNGVPASQLTATTNNGSLCDLGEKFVALDRAVTIEETK